MTGIKERRWSRDDQDTSDLAYEASKKAIEDAGIKPNDIDMIIVATATGDMPFPSVANILQEKLGTGKVPTMDQLVHARFHVFNDYCKTICSIWRL